LTSHLKQIATGVAGSSASEGSAAERSEAALTAEALEPAADPVRPPNPEVLKRPQRRTFTAEYKARILAEIDAGVIPVGKIIRRERLYSSHINVWRKEVAKTRLKALAPKARGPKPKVHDPLAIENIALRKQAAKLEKKLRKAEMLIEFQKKVSQLLGIALPIFEEEDEEKSQPESETS
jgi:transposase